MPRLGQITLFLSCCNERNARKLGETVNGQKDVYLFLTKPSTKEDLDIGNIAPVYSLRMKTFITFNCMKCSSFFYYCFPPPTPTHTFSSLSFGNFHYVDIGTYISIPKALKFFFQTFHFFLQYTLLARYSNSREVFCFFLSFYFQFLIIPIVILFIATYFFFNWLYVVNS